MAVLLNLPTRNCSSNFPLIWEKISLPIEGDKSHGKQSLEHYGSVVKGSASNFCFVDVHRKSALAAGVLQDECYSQTMVDFSR